MISPTETPKDAARRLAARPISEGYEPEALHEYRSVDGSISHWRIRAKHPDGRKWMRPMTLIGHGYELREPEFPSGRKPLYNLDRIAANTKSRVWIVEGEKPTDVLTRLGALATTSGSATSANDVDWSAAAGRDCVLWPDNHAESWRLPQEWALRMRRGGRAVLFVHHSGKGGAQRGSSKKEDTLDAVIMLKRPADYLPEQAARFEIHFEKYRGPAGDEVKAIEAVLAKDADGRSCWTWRTVDEGTFDRVVALANDSLKPSEIAAELEIHKSNVSRHIKRARSLGLIVGGTS